MYAHGMWRGLHLYKIFKETISRTSLEFNQDSTKRNYYGQVESDDNDIPALESLQVGRFSDVTFIHLREVKLMQTNGTIPGLQLMKLPFAKSPKMMRMLIEPCLVEESATIKILAELIKFERASPNAEVVYKLDKHSNPRRI
ncbi:hypothetical protein BC332_27504 [Capsicum chinense]|nr:hypothetical protein BC332_27504 [Capsicum chinense]